jgi:hypothetical protein
MVPDPAIFGTRNRSQLNTPVVHLQRLDQFGPLSEQSSCLRGFLFYGSGRFCAISEMENGVRQFGAVRGAYAAHLSEYW